MVRMAKRRMLRNNRLGIVLRIIPGNYGFFGFEKSYLWSCFGIT